MTNTDKIFFTALGGGDEIGANSFLISYKDFNLILDSGLHPRKKGKEIFPNYEDIKDLTIQNLIITHAHNDHIGALPYFLNKFPYANIYTTKPTASVAEVTLVNTAGLMEREFRFEWDTSYLKYYKEEILNIIPLIIKQIDYNSKINLKEEVKFEFTDAGHLLGSACVLLNIENRSIYFTGDINFRQQKLIKPAVLPRHKVDVLITECTNGMQEKLPSYDSEEVRLKKFINEITGNGGSVLIPVFALGKAQEMLKRLSDMMTKNKIPHLPIYYSTLANALNRVYDDFNYTVRRVEKGLKLSEIPIRLLRRNDVTRGAFYKHPSIILATSGMVIEDTYSYRLAKHFLRRKDFGIAMTGYCDPETPGYKIKNSHRYERIILDRLGSEIVDVNCRVENFTFSSHAQSEDLIKMVEKLDPEKVILVHGDKPAIDRIGQEILERFPWKKVLAPERLRKYEILEV